MAIKYPLARLSPTKQELILLAITRESVISNDIAPALNRLEALIDGNERAIESEGRLSFCFERWDDDPRETSEIPEIRAYFQALTVEFPYWIHIVEKVGDSFFHVMRLLCDGHYVRPQPGLVGWYFDDMPQLSNTVETLLTSMTELHLRLGLPVEIGQRISQEVAQLIECSLE
jgi:hypothetical protein